MLMVPGGACLAAPRRTGIAISTGTALPSVENRPVEAEQQAARGRFRQSSRSQAPDAEPASRNRAL